MKQNTRRATTSYSSNENNGPDRQALSHSENVFASRIASRTRVLEHRESRRPRVAISTIDVTTLKSHFFPGNPALYMFFYLF